MVVETVAGRERTSQAIMDALKDRSGQVSYAIDLVEALQAHGVEPVEAISTIWRLIDENRLFFDENGRLVLEKPERG